ncbi:putative lipoprotein [Burkholderia pseudomallei MSHR5609]|nr:putative lipoprotein [Burkholderia pseudomallei]KGS58464.1 putative lipoprotein [Burkholderia pseudomallei MSHR5609]
MRNNHSVLHIAAVTLSGRMIDRCYSKAVVDASYVERQIWNNSQTLHNKQAWIKSTSPDRDKSVQTTQSSQPPNPTTINLPYPLHPTHSATLKPPKPENTS